MQHAKHHEFDRLLCDLDIAMGTEALITDRYTCCRPGKAPVSSFYIHLTYCLPTVKSLVLFKITNVVFGWRIGSMIRLHKSIR